MQVYKTRRFARWARNEGVSDKALRTAVREMSEGLYEANLGGNLFKKRIARPGHGKRGGFRTIVATNLSGRWFFLYGFAKNERDNIERGDEQGLKDYADRLLGMTPEALSKLLDSGALTEVNYDA